MSLTIEQKRRLRNRKDKYLELYKGDKLKLPISVLEELLFDYDELLGIKKIGFYSHNLSKLDLSKLSFDGVNLDNEFFSDEIIDLSNTNAHIDFSKTPQYKESNVIKISNINLDNVDLSNNNLEELSKCNGKGSMRNCSLCNTGLVFTSDTRISFANCNLSYNKFIQDKPLLIDPNFSCQDDDIVLYTNKSAMYDIISAFRQCNISHTGAKITSTYSLLRFQLENIKSSEYLKQCTIVPSEKNSINRILLISESNKHKDYN